MALNYVTLILDGFDGGGTQLTRGTATFTPSVQLTDPTDQEWIPPAPVSAEWRKGLAAPQVSLLATDNANVLPAGWGWKVSFLNVPGAPAPFSFFLPFSGGATQRLSQLSPVSSVATLAAAAVPGVYVTPSGDATGVTDTALIQGLENLGAKTIYFGSGTFWTTGLIKQAGTIWQGAGRLQTVIKLANGANTDVIQGAGFPSLTLSGSSTGGIGGWGIRDLSIDGNNANQSGTSWGLRVYGYQFDLSNVSIRNCLTGPLYTEFGNFGQPGSDRSMEAHYRGLELHDTTGNGWVNRGPHDSRAYDVTMFGLSSTSAGYWAQTPGAANVCTVAAGSNGVNVSTFAGAGVLNVTTTLGFPSASINSTQGSLTVATSGTPAVITYTGITATSFTGCALISGNGTLSTGGTVSMTGGGYSANGCLLEGCHVYGNPLWNYILDAQTHLTDCIGEVAQPGGGMVLMRAWYSAITGGVYFVIPSATQLGCGIQIGDTVNSCGVYRVSTLISNLAGTTAATAAVNIVNDGGGDLDAVVNQASGQAAFGTPQANSQYRVFATGGTVALNRSNNLTWGVPLSGVFGDGSDSNAVLDGTTSNGFSSLGGSTYTMTRDAYLTSLTVNNGITLATGGFRLFVAGAAVNNGIISCNGNAGTAAGGGGAVTSSASSLAPGGAGGGGNTAVGANGTGGGGANMAVGSGGAGGSSGASGGNNAGGSGAGVLTGATGSLRLPQILATGTTGFSGAARQIGGAPGGGQGGGDGVNKGGGGGSGGGMIGVAAWSFVNNGTLSAKGGDGGTPTAGNAGGGGPGGGGLILVFTLIPWTAGTTNVTAGTPGSGVGTGAAGSTGAAGKVANFVVQ